MKYIITERQYSILQEQEQILELPGLDFFNNDWNWLQDILRQKGNPLYSLSGDVDLGGVDVKDLGNLISVGGFLELEDSSIESLGNLTSVGGELNLQNTSVKSLGNLISVGGNLNLYNTPIESLGNLTSVGGCLTLWYTPISEKYSESDIDGMVDVGGGIFVDEVGINDNGDSSDMCYDDDDEE